MTALILSGIALILSAGSIHYACRATRDYRKAAAIYRSINHRR
ncbi:hypothetical protein Q5762_07355 [Streptomyces sp. P9(2023)]|nr:hypothetical protein [Streptomyces sp. P9(2023)]MDT9688173.1 hypothetical protein [Streptomyces sp. P9(2023)]